MCYPRAFCKKLLFVYICVAALGPPEFVSSDFESIAMKWNASKSSKFAVQLWNNKTRTWVTAHCKESMAADSCVKESPRATVVNLKPSTLYYFRIYVSRLSVSSPSEPMKRILVCRQVLTVEANPGTMPE